MRKVFSIASFGLPIFILFAAYANGASKSSYYRVLEHLAALSQTCRTTIQKEGSGVFVIAGFSGDLSKRKLLPALYELVHHGFKGVIVGLGRSDLSVDKLIEEARIFIPRVDEKMLLNLRQMTHYFNTSNPESMSKVSEFIQKQIQERRLFDRRIFYLATPSDSFCPLTKQAVESGIIQKGNKDHIIVYEKPFGKDLSSAQAVNKCLNLYIPQEQQYLVDHYLTKTLIKYAPRLVSYLSSLGFIIHDVEFFFDEKIGIEGRGSFYEEVGVLNDVVQNHALQILATFVAGATHAAKTTFLHSLQLTHGIFGQYDGYRNEKDVDPLSIVPTYTELFFKTNPVSFPISIRAGKKLSRKATELRIRFSKPQGKGSALLTIRLAPSESLSLRAPLVDSNPNLARATLDITFPINTTEPYTVLLSRLISGDTKMSVTQEEIEAQWHIIDTIQREVLPFMFYAPGFGML